LPTLIIIIRCLKIIYFFFSNKEKDGNWKAFGKLENTHEFKGHISLLDKEIIGCGNKLSKMNSVSKKELQIKNPFDEIFLINDVSRIQQNEWSSNLLKK
jgi:hypothetical protein